MGKKNVYITFIIAWLLLFLPIFVSQSAGTSLFINSQSKLNLELVGYNGLKDFSIVKTTASPEKRETVITFYRGLALLNYSNGSSYPLILNNEPFTFEIKNASQPPSFKSSVTNEYFYDLLAGKIRETDAVLDEFAYLMIQAKNLLESSSGIATASELQTKREEFYHFIRDHYNNLKNSDMIRRLVAQSFMMHEYVNYHIKDEPATNIKKKYQSKVLECAKGWLETLKPHIPEHETLNYIVLLYYDRSMVSMASFIANNFKEYAFCPGTEKKDFGLKKTLMLTGKKGQRQIELHEIQGDKILAFVSGECSVSMVQAISFARLKDGSRPKYQIIVVPVKKLSVKHFTMGKKLSTSNLYFVQDDKWIEKNVPDNLRLPHLVNLREMENEPTVDMITK